jgi:hypothetical protein
LFLYKALTVPLLRPPVLLAVVDDLLSAFMGLNGSYVRVRLAAAPGGDRLSYEVAPRGQLEPAMQEMAARMLPIWWALLPGAQAAHRALWGALAHAAKLASCSEQGARVDGAAADHHLHGTTPA